MLPRTTWTLAEPIAGLQAQALGLAEAAGLKAESRPLRARFPWCHLPPNLWPSPLTAIEPDALAPCLPDLLIGCGGKAAVVLAALRGRTRTVIVQHPRLDPRRFDLAIVGPHDGLTGENVLVARTALHRASPARLAKAAGEWLPRLAHLRRPLVSVLVGGNNGRFRLDAAAAGRLADQFAAMIERDQVGLALTPSRRTGEAAREALSARLRPLGAEVWDMSGDNPYFGMLALADAIIVTTDSVSMISEAVATSAPVLIAPLPGRSRRNASFVGSLIDAGRVRPYHGRLETWETAPLDDTAEVAGEMCRRLGFRD